MKTCENEDDSNVTELCAAGCRLLGAHLEIEHRATSFIVREPVPFCGWVHKLDLQDPHNLRF
jgi:hypothetical protein